MAPVPLSGVTVTLISGSAYRVAGLAGATTADGSYQLTVAGTGIADLAGNSGHRIRVRPMANGHHSAHCAEHFAGQSGSAERGGRLSGCHFLRAD